MTNKIKILVICGVALLLIIAGLLGWSLLRREYTDVIILVDVETRANQHLVDIDLWINGKLRYKNLKPGTTVRVSLKPGKYTLRATAPGYADCVEKIVTGPSGGEGYLVFKLHRRT